MLIGLVLFHVYFTGISSSWDECCTALSNTQDGWHRTPPAQLGRQPQEEVATLSVSRAPVGISGVVSFFSVS